MWRIWKEQNVSLTELKKWTYTDIIKANAILDMFQTQDVARNALDLEELEQSIKRK